MIKGQTSPRFAHGVWLDEAGRWGRGKSLGFLALAGSEGGLEGPKRAAHCGKGRTKLGHRAGQNAEDFAPRAPQNQSGGWARATNKRDGRGRGGNEICSRRYAEPRHEMVEEIGLSGGSNAGRKVACRRAEGGIGRG